MDYEEAVAKAPPGWRHFTADDIARLPREVLEHEMARVPPGAIDAIGADPALAYLSPQDTATLPDLRW